MLHHFEVWFNWNLKTGIVCTLPVSGMCCRPVCTQLHSWVAMGTRGVNDLTEDSVELTRARQQTICSFHQQLLELQKIIPGKYAKTSYKTGIRKGGNQRDAACSNGWSLDCSFEEISSDLFIWKVCFVNCRITHGGKSTQTLHLSISMYVFPHVTV